MPPFSYPYSISDQGCCFVSSKFAKLAKDIRIIFMLLRISGQMMLASLDLNYIGGFPAVQVGACREECCVTGLVVAFTQIMVNVCA